MNVYDAIMAAADLIERTPEKFNFYSVWVPEDGGCGTPGCALGWIGALYGKEQCRDGNNIYVGPSTVARNVMGLESADTFYMRMTQIGPGWTTSAEICARNLRSYAAKYRAPEKPRQTFDDFKRDLLAKVAGERIPEDAVNESPTTTGEGL